MRVSQPKRAERTYTQSLIAPPAAVFPLLCPVREADWVSDWRPIDVWTRSGVAERDCVFTTPAGDTTAIWFVTRHEPDRLFTEMLKIVPAVTACRLTIQLRPTAAGCAAEIMYSHTSLGTPEGDEFVLGFTEARYTAFMKEWEGQMNHYLRTGGRQVS